MYKTCFSSKWKIRNMCNQYLLHLKTKEKHHWIHEYHLLGSQNPRKVYNEENIFFKQIENSTETCVTNTWDVRRKKKTSCTYVNLNIHEKSLKTKHISNAIAKG